MQNAIQGSVRIALFFLLISVAFGTGAAFAQGSVGGSCGND
jgi:ABC-type spermidine/putrescine transport system permease subunit II